MNEIYNQLIKSGLISYVYAAIIFFGCFAIFGALRSLMRRRLTPLAEKTESVIDDQAVKLLTKTNKLCLTPIFLYLSSLPLEVSPKVNSILEGLAIAGGAVQVGIWAVGILSVVVEQKIKRQGGSAASATGLLLFFCKFGVWSFVLLFLLANFGVDITALVTGLGIGGIAVALAVQNILGDLIASLSIVLDKPFAVGDFVIVDDLMGNVEHIGVKTTRVRSLSGEQLIFSNSDLLSSRIRNYKRLFERRIVFSIGVTYQTKQDQLNEIPKLIESTIKNIEGARFDRSHFSTFGDSALMFETVYYVLSPDYAVYMDIQQSINLALVAEFENRGIEFAYPTRTLFVQNS